MITSERCEDIGSWLSENAQKETPEYTSTMAVRLYALTHSFSRRFGPRAPLNVAICRAALRWVAIRRDASRSDALCTGLRLRLRMAIRRYVAIRRDMWRCHALCVPYVSSIPLCPRTLGPRTSAGVHFTLYFKVPPPHPHAFTHPQANVRQKSKHIHQMFSTHNRRSSGVRAASRR